jgi:hypothetical protein
MVNHATSFRPSAACQALKHALPNKPATSCDQIVALPGGAEAWDGLLLPVRVTLRGG